MAEIKNIVRRVSCNDWFDTFCPSLKGKNRVITREVYMEDLGVGETIEVSGFENIKSCRGTVSESLDFGVIEVALGGRRYFHKVNEDELTYEVTRQR